MSLPPFQPNNNKPGRDFKKGSRPQIQLANHNLKFSSRNSKRPSHIATSNPCRDTVSAQSEQMRSRPQSEVATPNPQCPPETPKSQVAKPETYCNSARSRRHFLVVTSRSTKPGRDLNSMSRPQIGPNLLRLVAT